MEPLDWGPGTYLALILALFVLRVVVPWPKTRRRLRNLPRGRGWEERESGWIVANDDQGQDDSLTGLAKRWLKSQLRFHGDPIKARRDRQEADALEDQMHDKVQEDAGRAVFNAVLPERWKQKLGDLERHQEEQRLRAEANKQAEHEARPRADVQLSVVGDVTGAFQGQIPTVVDRPSQPGEAMTVDLSPLEPVAVGDRSWRGFVFAVPHYTGAGTYDLTDLARIWEADWDPFWFQLWFESDDEPFYWVADYGAATIVVEPGERTLRVQMPMEDAGSHRIQVDATVVLP